MSKNQVITEADWMAELEAVAIRNRPPEDWGVCKTLHEIVKVLDNGRVRTCTQDKIKRMIDLKLVRAYKKFGHWVICVKDVVEVAKQGLV